MVDKFLGNKKDPNYKELVKKLIKSYQNMVFRAVIFFRFSRGSKRVKRGHIEVWLINFWEIKRIQITKS